MIDRIGMECCGCAACVVNCPNNCVSMKKNAEGFLYPCIDQTNCTGCNLCEMKCPVVNKIQTESLKLGWLIRIRDEDILKNSASGGFFSAVAEKVLEEDGVFCGATFDKNWNVVHKGSSLYDDLTQMRGSKYVQSSIEQCFEPIKEHLKNGVKVIFCGTPCQVQAIKKYLEPIGSSDHLFTVDVACKGVGSPGLWENYLKYQKEKYKSNILAINFRKKVHGYHSSNMVIQFQKGKKSSKSKTDLYMRSYVNEYCSRESCYNCAFKGIDRCSDFTVYDAWHASDLIDIHDDDKGYSTVIVHNERAIEFLDQLRISLEEFSIDLEKSIELDGSMLYSRPKAQADRSSFLRKGCSQGIDIAIKQYFPITNKERLIEIIKDILHSIGLLQFVKKCFKHR